MIKNLFLIIIGLTMMTFVSAVDISNPSITGVNIIPPQLIFKNETGNASTFAEVWITAEGLMDDVSDIDVNDLSGITPFNGTYRVAFTAERGGVSSNNPWAWGNGASPQGSGVGFDSKVIKIQAQCANVGTTLEVVVRKNGVATACTTTIDNTANTIFESDCSVDFTSTDILGIYAGTETGAYSVCTGVAFVEYNFSLSGIKGDTGAMGELNGTIENLTINDFLIVNGKVNVSGGGDFIVNNSNLFVDVSSGMVGIATDAPVTGFHSMSEHEIVNWMDTVGRSTASYFQHTVSGPDLHIFGAIFGVDVLVEDGIGSKGVNGAFYSLSLGNIGESANFIGSAQRAFVSSVSVNVKQGGGSGIVCKSPHHKDISFLNLSIDLCIGVINFLSYPFTFIWWS